jgi:hypothetical protein
MKEHTTNYSNTFILIADDSAATAGSISPLKGDEYTVAGLHFEMIANHPYEFNSDDVIFAVFTRRKELAESELQEARKLYFSKGQPCFRASPLTKKYGWGIHHNLEGKVALFSRDSTNYMHFEEDSNVFKVKAMKSKK